MFNPLAVAMAIKRGDQNNAGLTELLSVFEDSMSIRMMLWVVGGTMSAVVGWVSLMMVFFLPKASSLWYWACAIFFSLAAAIAIYLIEPRPFHLGPSLERIRESFSSPSSWAQNVRRWWRWRKKFEHKTKLNV